ncbi:hypothetical protein BpHYR1_052157 [Brachionus plicatilis]|uniref:Uncharacterized protein n=1 Tax=Brachionus plicatilis TaxID=10195 RepID=A0A3M7R509_BRAPC|nr:hypothetical protein BpHYR1_052157 [Brachionus plicatilis]
MVQNYPRGHYRTTTSEQWSRSIALIREYPVRIQMVLMNKTLSRKFRFILNWEMLLWVVVEPVDSCWFGGFELLGSLI